MTTPRSTDPHAGQPVLAAGEPLAQARAAMLLIHGRGASAEDILSLAGEIDQPGFAYLAPEAAGATWYPNRFTAPIAATSPGSPPRWGG
jgi:predicted esterase